MSAAGANESPVYVPDHAHELLAVNTIRARKEFNFHLAGCAAQELEGLSADFKRTSNRTNVTHTRNRSRIGRVDKARAVDSLQN